MAVARRGRVFISYRRQDSAWPARQLYDALAARFGAHNVFKDVDDIDPGDDFVDTITEAVAQCDVLLALIGPQWLTMTDGQGRRRLDDPGDFVRVEIGAALARGVRVIPILIDTAVMPAGHELPPDLAPMVRRQAVTIDPVTFNTERLFATLAEIFERQAAAPATPVNPVAPLRQSAPTPPGAGGRPDDGPPLEAGGRRQSASSSVSPAGVPGKRPVVGAAAGASSGWASGHSAATGPVSMASARSAGAVGGGTGGAARRPAVIGLVAAALAVAVAAALFVLQPWRGAGGAGTAVVAPSSGSATPSESSPSPRGSSSAGVQPPGGPDAVWAHRGGLEEHQFSTLPALESAARHGYSVELDVRHTSDGVAVLVHDEQAEKGLDCGGRSVRVSELSYARLVATCRAKPTANDPNTYPVARFDRAMEAIAAASPSAWVFPEIKDDVSATQLRRFLAVIIDNGLRGRVVVTSFHRDRLARVRDLDPRMPTALLMMNKRVPAADLKDDRLWGVGVEKGIATKQYVQQLKANGSRVTLWTLNDEEQWQWAKELGVDTVMTDFPNRYTAWKSTQ